MNGICYKNNEILIEYIVKNRFMNGICYKNNEILIEYIVKNSLYNYT